MPLLGVCSAYAFACAFCSRFLFSWICFLLAGSLGNSGFVQFCLLFLILRISGFSSFSRVSCSGLFLDFLHYREFLVLVGFYSVLFAGLADNHFFSWTLWPMTSSSFHPIPHHSTPSTQPHPTTSQPHPTTIDSRPHIRRHTCTSPSQPIITSLMPNWYCPLVFLWESGPHQLDRWVGSPEVWILNLGALPIIASISFTHLACLCACFYECSSCVYTFFSTCLSTCVARAACFVFSSVFIITCMFSFLTNLLDNFVTVPIDVHITLLICLDSFSNCIFISLIPAYVCRNLCTHFPPIPYSYTFIAVFICMFCVLLYIHNHLFVFCFLVLQI